jgi:hypothetical protein
MPDAKCRVAEVLIDRIHDVAAFRIDDSKRIAEPLLSARSVAVPD